MRISDWSSDVCSSDLEFSSWPALIASPILQNIMPASPAPTPSRAHSPAKSPPASFPSTTNRPQTICSTPTPLGSLPRTSPARFSTSLPTRSEEHTSELQSLMRISYAVFCLKKKKKKSQLQTQELVPSMQIQRIIEHNT